MTTAGSEPKSPVPDNIQIQSASHDITTFDEATLAKLTWKGDVSCGPYSFADPKDPVDPTCPPPLYFNDERILQKQPVNKDDMMAGFEVNKDGSLKVTD